MMRRQQPQQEEEDETSRALYELSTMVLNLLRYPPTPSSRSNIGQITPAGFAYLLLGMSLSLMLCGSVTFFIGLMLMPWVIGIAMVFYVAGIVSTILSYLTAPRNNIPGKTNYITNIQFPNIIICMMRLVT
ncbi:hypothetical protein Lalb_Chr23g0278191 [Lupinus albus]|uniref:Uncharacterized protein n=1 Tax=Lupinus albus TaxID=3870 RepID=A0A6A4NME0_LUPAL|nr:hypothetical protein Lalb_Chr23g0278191 [Lupinus albus]